MKKIFSLLLIAIVCVTLVGCGSKTNNSGGSGGIFGGGNKITCTKEGNEDGYPTKNTITVTYEGNKLTYVEGSNTTTYESKEVADSIYAFMPLANAIMEEVGFTVDIKQEGSSISMNYKGNIEEISKNTKYEDLDMDYDYDTTEKDFRQELTEDGYTCK